MDQYVTGNTIKKLREKNHLTQEELADKLFLSSKTISKWETGKGFPDVSILEDLASSLNVSLTELFSGDLSINTNVCANMLKTNFYICPICANVITSVGNCFISCHGINLNPLEYEETEINYEKVEDEIYVKIDNPMTKDDYISFIAGVGSDYVQIKKLYRESSASTRLKIRGLKYIYYYSNRNGLFRSKFIYKK